MNDPTANSSRNLTDGLTMMRSDDLRPMVKWLGFPNPRPTRKADMAVAIKSRLTATYLRQLWKDLDKVEQAAVSEALYSPARKFIPHRFYAKYGKLPAYCSGRNYRLDLPVHFFLYSYGGYGAADTVPDDLREILREFVPVPPDVELLVQNELPESINRMAKRHHYGPEKLPLVSVDLTQRNMELAASHDLLTVLRLIDHGRISASAKTRRATGASVKRIAKELHGGEYFEPEEKVKSWDQVVGPVRAAAWPWLVQAGKLAEIKGTKLALTKTGRAALGAPAEKTLHHLWQRWLKTAILDEFSRIDTIKGQQRGRGRRSLSAATQRRQIIAAALMACPVGEWISFDEFTRFMIAAGFEFNITTDTWNLYISDPQYGRLGYSNNSLWPILQGRYLLCVLFEYVSTLGMIDIAYTHPNLARPDFTDLWCADELCWLSQYDGLEYFRLNPLGAYCLEIADDYEPEIPVHLTPLTVFPDLRVCSESPPSADERLTLETFANIESEGVWRLARGKTLSAVENGHNLTSLRDFLTARDPGQLLPETVEGFLRGIERNARAMKTLGGAILIECSDQEVAAKLVSDKRVSKLCLPAGKNHLVVRTASEKAFRKAVHDLGYGIVQS